MNLTFTIKTENEAVLRYINTATFQLPCGATLTVDRHTTSIYTLSSTEKTYAMEWTNVYPWELNGVSINNPEPTPFDPYVAKLLFEDTKFLKFDFDDEVSEVCAGEIPEMTVSTTYEI